MLSRSRSYLKNDNRFVEENNFSLVWAYIGYQRLDLVEQTNRLNQLFDLLWLYHNFFQPVMRLTDKIPTADPLCYKRIYDQAQPPFNWLYAKVVLPPHLMHQLHALRETTNLCLLRRSIESLTTQLFDLPPALEGVTEDVHQTLGLWQP